MPKNETMPVPAPEGPKIGALARFLGGNQIRDLVEIARALLAEGTADGEAARVLARLLDDLLDFRALVPGPVGVALEAADRPVLRALAGLILAAARRPR